MAHIPVDYTVSSSKYWYVSRLTYHFLFSTSFIFNEKKRNTVSLGDFKVTPRNSRLGVLVIMWPYGPDCGSSLKLAFWLRSLKTNLCLLCVLCGKQTALTGRSILFLFALFNYVYKTVAVTSTCFPYIIPTHEILPIKTDLENVNFLLKKDRETQMYIIVSHWFWLTFLTPCRSKNNSSSASSSSFCYSSCYLSLVGLNLAV